MFEQSGKEQASSSARTLWTLESGKDAELASGHPVDHVIIPREISTAMTDRKAVGNKRQFPVLVLGETKQTSGKKRQQEKHKRTPHPTCD